MFALAQLLSRWRLLWIAGGILAGFGCATPARQFAAPEIWLTSRVLGGTPRLADVDGDGREDLVIFQGGPVQVALSQGTSFAPARVWHNSFCVGEEVCETGDVDGDGKADVLAFRHGDGRAEGSAFVWVARSDGTKFVAASTWNDGFCITEQTCTVGDVNGDKRADIVAYTPKTGLVWTSLSTGAAFGTNGVWHKFFCIPGEVCTLGDVDGDGKFDLVLFKPTAPPGQKGNVLWAPSTGGAFGAVKLGHGYFCIDQERCFVADFDGDRRSDVMLMKRPMPWESLVSLSNGTQFINPDPFTWSSNIPGYPGDVGDANGDGRADVLTYEYVSGNVADGARYFITLTSDGRPTAPPSDSTPTSGLEGVDFFNCLVERRPMYLFVTDENANMVYQYGPIDDGYDESGNCPSSDVDPFDVNFVDGHQYTVVAVDPANAQCGVLDPSVLGCQRQVYQFRGRDAGGRIQITVPTEWP